MSIFYLGFSVIFSLLLSLFSLRVKSTIKIWQHKLLIFVIGIINILILTLKIDIRWDFPFGDNLILSMFLNSAIIYAIIIGIYIKIRQKYFKKLQKIAKIINNNAYKDQEAGIINNYDIKYRLF